MPRHHDMPLCELDASLADATVLAEEYAGYDEGAARRRIARRIADDRARSAPPGGTSGAPAAPACGPADPAATDDLVLDAACHVRAARGLDDLTWCLVESRDFAELALAVDSWPHGVDSALLFGCLLHLADRTEGAQFWFQYAAGAGSQTAARCLYLHHLARAEVATAQFWKRQAHVLPPDDHLPPLPQVPHDLEEALGASVIWTSPPISTQDLTSLTGGPGRARPPLRLPARLRQALMARPRKEHPDLGEVFTPGPQVAVAVAQNARLNPLHLTEQANGWSLEALKQPQPTPAARTSPEGRPAPAALESVHRALRVLEVVNRCSSGVNLTQIARETKLPQLVLARAVEQLVRASLATPVGPDAYAAGHALLLGETDGAEGRGHLRETLAWLRDAVGAAVYVARYTDGEVAITQYADGPGTPVVEEWVDFRVAAHASAVGKALLAQLDHDDRRDHLARHRLTPFTPRTLTSRQVLFRQLDERPPNTPLLDLQEYALGTVCAAVPIAAGPHPECVALSIPVTDPGRLKQAARILQSEAAAVLLALVVAGSTRPTARRPEDTILSTSA
ncbi:IclR family transcriptional regulator C-terminal domain-containing protein [Streptomyces yangpuensis]|uniref:IclR family transcriptional regulator n=1 Tax=Streptomyces yangpuensis TaxID=1648182 RepID=UPI00381923F5